MYQIGDMVMHGGNGVCRVTDIRREKFAGDVAKTYYVLQPVYESAATTVYIPTDSERINLRRLLTGDDIHDLIRSVSTDTTLWVEDDRQRQDKFQQILRSGDHALVIQLIKEIHEKKQERIAAGRKLRASDERILQEAQRLLHQEFAFALDIPTEDVAAFIVGELDAAAAEK